MEPTPLDICRSLVAKGDLDAAIQRLSEFLNGAFFHDEALFMLGACMMAKGMNGLSAVLTSAAIDSRAAKGRKFPEALINLGGAYKAERHNGIAERIWRDALEAETVPSERAKILANLAGLYVNEGDPERAIPLCDQALKEDPQNYGAQANRGMACLELGRWREGWRGFRATYLSEDRNRRVYPGIPEWDGSPGKRVICWGDQGIGDEIFFANSLPDLIAVSQKVILDCHPRLPALFQHSFPEIEVHGTRKDLSALPWLKDCGAEAAIGLADLPLFFRNETEEWRGAPYLKAPPHYRCERSGLRIGISWTGGTKRTRTDLRSLPLAAMEPILRARPDAQWFSLQYRPPHESTSDAAREVCELEERTGIRISHYPGWVECFDYSRTAAFVASLDLVITVCTTAHHLAGALGIPCWTLVPSRPSWRYQIRGERLPWYDSVRLFRQDKDGDWSGPVERIARELADFR
jgi:tetratricopeptide (TPR) repeat protein